MSMRVLVACPGCRRQYDAGAAKPGAKYHCSCGATLTVPRVQPQDAAVVRCSGCGAPRDAGAKACGYCKADFTLHERDMHTICAVCMARVSDRARYCHSCASPIAPEGTVAGAPTDRSCPACAKATKLESRSIGDPPLAVLECPSCAGIWLGENAFRVAVDRARSGSHAMLPLGELKTRTPVDTGATSGKTTGSLYRSCPECGNLMNRRNYGKRSGVIVDTCRKDGVWFDASELERVLTWIREGGEQQAAVMAQAEERASAYRKAGTPAPGVPPQAWDRQKSGWSEGGWLQDLAEFVVDLGWFRF